MNYRTADLAAALGERFTSFKLLGQGGEGAVFAVYDRSRKEDIALKLTLDTGEPGLAERFEQVFDRVEHQVQIRRQIVEFVAALRIGNARR